MNLSANHLSERRDQVTCLLMDAPIDMSPEKALLETMFDQPRQETLLVVGDSQAAPYTLLPWEEQIFWEQDHVPFPLTVRYDDTFSIEIIAADGSTERYRTISDFRSFCIPRLSQLQQCTVLLPQEMLRQRTLLYFQLDGNLPQLIRTAKDCTGCIMVVEARAGGLSEDYLALGQWLTKERCIASRTALLLHYHSRLANAALPLMAEQLLNRNKLGTFSCGTGKRDLLSMTTALEYAILDLQDRSLTGMDQGILRACCIRAQKKLEAAAAEAHEQETKARVLAEKYQEASDTFQRMHLIELQGLYQIFPEEDQNNVCTEVSDFFKEIRNSLPAMIEDVADNSPSAKEDLRHLAGDYINALVDNFTDALLQELSTQHLVPRTQTIFQNMCGRFRRLMQDPQLEYARLEAQVEMEFLQMSDINIGDYQNTVAQLTSTLLSNGIQLILTQKFGFLGYNMGEKLREVVDYLIVERRYVRDLTKRLLDTLDEQEAEILEQLRSSLFPRLVHVLRDEFEELGNVYYRQLRQRYEEYESSASLAAQKQEKLANSLEQLIALTPADPSADNAQ